MHENKRNRSHTPRKAKKKLNKSERLDFSVRTNRENDKQTKTLGFSVPPLSCLRYVMSAFLTTGFRPLLLFSVLIL